jgi:AcrR family transcriptional regulator
MDIKSEQNMEQAILETAERLFLEKGFAATSTTQIAKAVGCNQALVHYYFRTQE